MVEIHRGEKVCLASMVYFSYSPFCCSGQALEIQKWKENSSGVNYFQVKVSGLRDHGPDSEVTLSDNQGLAILWWKYCLFLPSLLQKELGLLQDEEAFDIILKTAQGAAPKDVKWASVQSTCGWMLLEMVSGNYCCIYSTVKKGSRKYL